MSGIVVEVEAGIGEDAIDHAVSHLHEEEREIEIETEAKILVEEEGGAHTGLYANYVVFVLLH